MSEKQIISIRNAPNAKKGLFDLIQFMDEKTPVKSLEIVEIGCYVGDATAIFAGYFKHIYAVDPWENGYDPTDAASYQHPMAIIEKQFDEMARNYNNISKLKMPSDEAVKHFPHIDAIYIDGVHTYDGCKKDLNLWRNLVKPGGFICGHDYQSRFPGVMKAVDEFGKPDKLFSDTSWAFQV